MANANPTLFDSLQQEVEYREIPGFPGYRVGNDGSAWSCWASSGRGACIGKEWRRLKPWIDVNGYPVIGARDLSRKKHKVKIHTLVLTAFVGPRPEGMECRHLNGVPTDCRLENLAWGTAVENAADKVICGTEIFGIRNGMSKLSPAEVLAIRKRLAAGEQQKAIAKDYGVGNECIHKIAKGQRWAWLES